MVTDTEEPLFASDPVALDISFGSRPRQSRVTVAFRILLALPHIVVLWLLGLVAGPLVIVGWIAALFLGRLPRWIARYEMGVIAYSTRVNAYAYLLADKFPPFGFSAPDYSIVVKIGASRLSRLKVFFRWLLLIPAAVVGGIAGVGLLVFSPVIWFITLVLGRMPQPFFGAVAAVIRYQARYSAYTSLVTDEYPRRLFGDSDSEWAPEGFELRLSEGAKWLTGLIVVLGIAAGIANIVLQYELTRPPPRNPAVVAAEGRLDRVIDHSFAEGACNLGCEKAHEQAFGEALQRFASDISRIRFPISQHRRVAMLIADVRATGEALIAASKSKDGGRAHGFDPADPADSVGFILEAIAKVLGPGPSDYPYGGYIC